MRRSWLKLSSRPRRAACTFSTSWSKPCRTAREAISPYAPRIIKIKINPDKIRDVIGPGGKVIRSLVEETGAKIDVEDDGTVSIATADSAAAEAAVARIRGLTAEAEIGQTYVGTVSRIVDFGAFVEIFPGTDGLLHISEIADRRIRDVRDELKEGQQIMVKCIGKEGNKIKLSRKAVLHDENPKARSCRRRQDVASITLAGDAFHASPAFSAR